jgi:hypothetical protein
VPGPSAQYSVVTFWASVRLEVSRRALSIWSCQAPKPTITRWLCAAKVGASLSMQLELPLAGVRPVTALCNMNRGLAAGPHLQHRRHARPRRGEHREERISLSVHFLGPVSGQTGPDERVMVGKHPRVDASRRRRSNAVEPSMSVNRNVKVSTGKQ